MGRTRREVGLGQIVGEERFTGVHAAAGVRGDVTPSLGGSLSVPIQYFVASPDGYDPLAVLLAAALHVRF